jgi:hypothetical protein
MNGVEPFAWLTATLDAIAAGHPTRRIDQILPWNFKPRSSRPRQGVGAPRTPHRRRGVKVHHVRGRYLAQLPHQMVELPVPLGQAPPRPAPAAGAETRSKRPPIAPPRGLKKDGLRGLTAMRNGAGATG